MFGQASRAFVELGSGLWDARDLPCWRLGSTGVAVEWRVGRVGGDLAFEVGEAEADLGGDALHRDPSG